MLGIQAVSGVFWTLLIEIKFYVFIAIQYALLGRRHMHAILVGLVLFEVIAWTIRGHGSLTLAYFPVFYLGIEIALAEESEWNRCALLRLAAVTLLLSGSLCLCLDQQNYSAAGYLVGGAVLFVVILRSNFSNRLASFIGVTSYSNYLYHPIIAGGVFAMVTPRPGSTSIAAVVVAFVAATAIAAAFYGLIEAPMVRLGRRLTARRSAIR